MGEILGNHPSIDLGSDERRVRPSKIVVDTQPYASQVYLVLFIDCEGRLISFPRSLPYRFCSSIVELSLATRAAGIIVTVINLCALEVDRRFRLFERVRFFGTVKIRSPLCSRLIVLPYVPCLRGMHSDSRQARGGGDVDVRAPSFLFEADGQQLRLLCYNALQRCQGDNSPSVSRQDCTPPVSTLATCHTAKYLGVLVLAFTHLKPTATSWSGKRI